MGYARHTSTAAKLAAAVVGTAASMYSKRRRASSTKTASKTRAKVGTSSRRRTGSRTVTRRKKTRETTQPVGEYSRSTTALGRKPAHTLSAAWKLLDQNISSNVYAYRAYNVFGGTSGAISLQNTSPSTTTGPFNLPMHMWEVTSAMNVIAGNVTAPNVFWTPQLSNPTDTASITWVNNLGTLSVENTDNATTIVNSYPAGNDTFDWFQAKMVFYCPTALPCRYQIDVVQLTDQRLTPGAASTPFATAFYQALAKRFAYNPIESGNSRYKKYLKTLYTQSFILNPKETTESVNTIFREVNLFMRMNRRCTYDWEDQDRMNMLGNEGQVNSDLTIKTQVHPRARIFLLIRAQANNAVSYTPTIMPSYDFVLRMKHSQFTG